MQPSHWLILGVGPSLILFSEMKEVCKYINEHWVRRVAVAIKRASKNRKVIWTQAKSWAESEGPNVECVDHQVSWNASSNLGGCVRRAWKFNRKRLIGSSDVVRT